MKSVKRILSLIIATALVLSSLPFAVSGGGIVASAAVQADATLDIDRPLATVAVTEVTRVAYSAYTMRQPSGDNSVIVKATPSGMPELRSSFNSIAYAGETPVATQISFTPGVALSSDPTISCSNTTVTFSDYSYSNGTYSWFITGGTATVGTNLIFTVTYSYTAYNAVTGKNYTNTYNTYGSSYVEAIVTPAGEYSTKRTYEDFFFGQSTKNRSYIASYVLGANTYGTLYANGEGEGSVNFESTGSAPDWTTEYGMMHRSDGHSANRDYNIAYDPDGNRPFSYVYFDKSLHSSLSDLNLRLVTANLNQAENSGERVSVYHHASYIDSGVTDTFDGEDDNGNPPTDPIATGELGLTSFSGYISDTGASFLLYFTGSGPSEAIGTNDYTVSVRYRTPGGWSEVYVGHSHSLRVVTYDKGSLRTLVERIQTTDPAIMTTDVPAGGFKGYNPQSWYYSAGWEAFSNAYNSAKACLVRPDTTQEEINEKYAVLQEAYDSLEMRVADYSIANAYYNQALAKNKNNYTLASWAKVQNILDNYVSNYSVIYQPAVDKLAADLKLALDSLQEATADYSVFNKHLSTVNNLMRKAEATYGMPAEKAYNNWSNLVSALTRSGCVYDELDGYVVAEPLLISQQPTVDGYVLVLERAIDALSLTSANYTEAGKAEAAYKLVKLNQVVDEFAAELTAAYDALVALHGKDLSYQSKIDEATATLNDLLSRIQYKPADVTAAANVLAVAYSLDRTMYEDMSAVDQAIANLESKMNLDIRYQNDINRAVSALQSAIDNLGKNIADYTSVYNAISAVQEHEELIRSTYADTYGFTADMFYSNWSAVVTAMNNVVYGLDFTQQSTVEGYTNAILLALNSLKENTADYTRVRELQDEAYSIVSTGEGLYSEKSLDNLTSVYINVILNKPISEQAVVDGYAESIQSAIDNLEYLPADYKNVNDQLALAQAELDKDEAFTLAHPGYTYYTSESISELNVAVASVVDGLDIRYQSDVDSYATAIQYALSKLEVAPADYTQVDLKILEVPSDLTLYTTLSVATLNATINSIKRTYTADKQATVDRYVTSLDNAIKGLKFKPADYSSVTLALEAAENEIAKGIYTENSINNLREVMDSVEYGYTIDRQDEVNAFAYAIEVATDRLALLPPDYTELRRAIDEAWAKINEGIYADDAVKALKTLVEGAEREMNSGVLTINDQQYVDSLVQTIDSVIDGLWLKNADYSSVQNAINAANEKIATGLYTDGSVALLQAEIDKVVYGLDITYQPEVDQFASNIVNLTNELVLKLADYTELQKILDLLDNSSSEIYTNTYKNFNEVMYLISSYRENTVSQNMALTVDKQSQVDEMASTLQGYIDMLEPAEPEIPVVEEKFELAGTAAYKTVQGKTYIVGVKERLTAAVFKKSYVAYENVTVDVTASGGRYIGTGSVVTVTSTLTGEVIATYEIVLFGDINGDALIDTTDSVALFKVLVGEAPALSNAYKVAANLEGTRPLINDNDKSYLDDVINGAKVIDQTTGQTE